MEIPNQKNSSSPITGRSPRQTKAGGTGVPEIAGAEEEEEHVDIAIDDVVFERSSIALPPRAPLPQSSSGPVREVRRSTSRKEPEPEKEGEARRKNPLERRTSGQPLPFKRLLRPRTALAASAAADEGRAESHASLESVNHQSMQFGKIHQHMRPDYRPNRLFRVLDSIYTHSPLRWLDFIESGGVRVFTFTLIFCALAGAVFWKYYDTLVPGAREGKNKPEGLTVEQRMEHGREAARNFMAAQTIGARLPLVMDPERAESRMRQFYESMKGEDPKVTSWEVGEPVAGKQGSWLPFIFEDSAGHKVTVVMGESETGYRIDWENFVAFGDEPWAEYCRARPTMPKTMRVRARLVETYAGSYTRETWQSYEIEHRSGGPRLIGYASRTGRTGQALMELVKGYQWQSAQLYLQFEASAGGENLVVIQDIVRSRWQDEATSWTGP